MRYYSEAGPVGMNGMPCFMSFHWLYVDEQETSAQTSGRIPGAKS